MKITYDVQQAIRSAIKDAGGLERFCRRLDGVSPSTVKRWLSDADVNISKRSYNKLYPYIANYFKVGFSVVLRNGGEFQLYLYNI